MSTPAIEVRDLTLRYGDTTALDGLSFSLEGGKIYGLLGRNGSGKTSLLSLLAAFRRPTSGDILVDGEPVFENSRRTREICLIRETGDTVESGERVRDALAFAASLRPYWDADYAARLLDLFEVPEGKRIRELSRGKQSSLGITLGLASRAPLTMLDESYLGMDAPSRYAFYDELLADFMAHPRTFIISTHLIEEVANLFEEVVIIDRGTLVLHEDTESLRARGATVTGPAEAVEQFAAGLAVLNRRQLGRTLSVSTYGALDEDRRRRARAAGIDIEPIPLQDLFVHLTASKGDG